LLILRRDALPHSSDNYARTLDSMAACLLNGICEVSGTLVAVGFCLLFARPTTMRSRDCGEASLDPKAVDFLGIASKASK